MYQTNIAYTSKICINVLLALSDGKQQKVGLLHDLQWCDFQYTDSLTLTSCIKSYQ